MFEQTVIDRIPNAQRIGETRFPDGSAFYLLRVGTLFPTTVRLWYLNAALTSEEIKTALDAYDITTVGDDGELVAPHTLFVVAGRLLGSQYVDGAIVDVPRWLQILHGINFGQVYVWQNQQWGIPETLQALHLEWGGPGTGPPRKVFWHTAPFDLTIDTRISDSWVRGFDGNYRTAYFAAVPNWWLGEAESHWTRLERERREERERIHEAARRASSAVHEEWLREEPSIRFAFTGRMTLDAARRILGVQEPLTLNRVKEAYRDLAKRYHPDLNPHPQAGEWMQAINAAYSYLEAT